MSKGSFMSTGLHVNGQFYSLLGIDQEWNFTEGSILVIRTIPLWAVHLSLDPRRDKPYVRQIVISICMLRIFKDTRFFITKILMASRSENFLL